MTPPEVIEVLRECRARQEASSRRVRDEMEKLRAACQRIRERRDAPVGRQVIVVDDCEADADLYEAILGDGFDVMRAVSFGEAVKALEESDPVALIVDRNLNHGGPTGTDLLERARYVPALKVLVTAGELSREELNRLFSWGVMVLLKPFSPAELRAGVEAFMRTHSVV